MSLNIKSKIENLKSAEYECLADLNIYDSPECTRLATQASAGRHLRVTSDEREAAVEVCLCEDDYPGWLSLTDLVLLQGITVPYQAKSFSEAEIKKLLPEAIAFTHKAMQQPNHYLWGGTVGPNYDCSGLMQAAFRSVGIWLPRDAYQQEGFTQPIAITELEPGDLIFFGTPQKATHVGLYLGDGFYIHSSGQDKGRNGIGIDLLSEQGDEVSQSYYQQLRGAGRVVKSYEPQNHREKGVRVNSFFFNTPKP
ncbi:MAG: C40 family peptidase [Fischerella sp.]|jgi:cell wall-associated NlpC family hydrolase|uniref:C40 family peptidase n=1 Tax=Fischerella sp. TaxID=1191 RepID=UPI00179D6D52|nr:C40 family peptidase [Fischerella sp.]NWF58426.1 C40 family peptidase [Fischerella sp.]